MWKEFKVVKGRGQGDGPTGGTENSEKTVAFDQVSNDMDLNSGRNS